MMDIIEELGQFTFKLNIFMQWRKDWQTLVLCIVQNSWVEINGFSKDMLCKE